MIIRKYEHLSASRADDGRISVYDESDDFMASFVDGKWVADQLFRWTDLEENFKLIYDEDEVIRLIAEARAALKEAKTA